MSEKIIFPGYVMDTSDPMMLGRVRAYPETLRVQDMIKGQGFEPITNDLGKYDIPDNAKWSEKDPFIYLPLLPYFIYQVPKVGEYIHVIYYNKEYEYQSQNQFYIQGPFSTPTAINKESYAAAQTFMTNQFRNKQPKFLKSNTYTDNKKEPQSVPYSAGVFPEPEDIAIMGRNSADIILKDNELVLRAGKFKGYLKPNQDISPNLNRAFLQLSNFGQTLSEGPEQKIKVPKLPSGYVSTLIEYTISNPSSSSGFTGNIRLYQLKEDVTTSINNFSITTNLDTSTNGPLKNLLYEQEFTKLSSDAVIEQINSFIKGVNEGFIHGYDNDPGFIPTGQFPMYYRPSQKTYNGLINISPLTLTTYENLIKIFSNVKPISSTLTPGFGLFYYQNSYLPKLQFDTSISRNIKYLPEYSSSIASLGAQVVYLLSHNEVIPSKGAIDFRGTLYGIPQTGYAFIDGKTDPMVRGEELMKLLTLIVNFLTTHVHPTSGAAPDGTSTAGITTQQIFSSLQDAPNTILNQNIRIN
jgi:hypothetical protein